MGLLRFGGQETNCAKLLPLPQGEGWGEGGLRINLRVGSPRIFMPGR